MRVLIIDDELLVRSTIRFMLETAGIEVAEASDGNEGIQSYRLQRADVVLSDMFMPEQDGLEVLRKLRSEFPDIKVIMMSGGGFGGSIDLLPLARYLGAAEVLPKPFKQPELLVAIKRVLSGDTLSTDPSSLVQ